MELQWIIKRLSKRLRNIILTISLQNSLVFYRSTISPTRQNAQECKRGASELASISQSDAKHALSRLHKHTFLGCCLTYIHKTEGWECCVWRATRHHPRPRSRTVDRVLILCSVEAHGLEGRRAGKGETVRKEEEEKGAGKGETVT